MRIFTFFLLSFKIFKYILDTNLLFELCVINILLPSGLYLFSLSGVSWLVKFLNSKYIYIYIYSIFLLFSTSIKLKIYANLQVVYFLFFFNSPHIYDDMMIKSSLTLYKSQSMPYSFELYNSENIHNVWGSTSNSTIIFSAVKYLEATHSYEVPKREYLLFHI